MFFRAIPSDEITAISQTLQDLLLCRHDQLPLELITHYFMYLYWQDQPQLHHHRQCVDAVQRQYGVVRDCYKIINNKICLGRFNPEKPRSAFCKDIIWHPNFSSEHELLADIENAVSKWKHQVPLPFPIRALIADKFLVQKIYSYHKCKRNMYSKMSQCIPKLKATCDRSAIRVAKTVRVTMETVAELLKDIPHLKVIHLIRDPRPVVLSRSRAATFKGKQSGNNLTLEASMYCSRVLRDVQLRKEMEKAYPNSFLQVIYEDFVKKPFSHAERVYRFLDEDMHVDTVRWLLSASNTSQSRADAWKDKLVYGIYERIGKVCRDLLEAIAI